MNKEVKCEKCINRNECKYRFNLEKLKNNINAIIRNSVFQAICINYVEVMDNRD